MKYRNYSNKNGEWKDDKAMAAAMLGMIVESFKVVDFRVTG
ncbi:MAG TPA: hypothetical protein VKA09_05480 [Nitrososphaeraceae archaeon]|jgi:hypothetical protein|nr:hypothetical protein [Nitrososphaeraceae archaeon]